MPNTYCTHHKIPHNRICLLEDISRKSRPIKPRHSCFCRVPRNICIPVPGGLTPFVMDICEFALAWFHLCSYQWDTMTETYFVLGHGNSCKWSGTNTRLPPAFWNGSICASFLIRCNSCQVALCESRDCRGSSEPLLMRCITHLKEVLCLPCLEYQDSKWLERCPGCNSWCRAKDQL
ncbi:hypothetical protein EDD22DRAFT_288095 [Suillus occidentalis]|nr:hypothetical protein EDD22DRAFT_288095 [Suillus occidentalis]